MSDDEVTTAEPQRSAEVEALYEGMRTAEFFAMSDADMERAVELLFRNSTDARRNATRRRSRPTPRSSTG
jgi:hypothetical protein